MFLTTLAREYFYRDKQLSLGQGKSLVGPKVLDGTLAWGVFTAATRCRVFNAVGPSETFHASAS
jgi:hypothetical protein